MKKTLVLGATTNPARFAYLATKRLIQYGHEVVLLGVKKGDVAGVPILTGKPALEGIDTVTLYINPFRQEEYHDYLLSLNPKRIIFNPGTEHSDFMNRAEREGVEVVPGCTLVMLSMGVY